MSPTPTPVPTTGNDHGWPQEWGTREAFPENPMARSSPGQGTAVPFVGRKSSPVFKAQRVCGASQQLQAQPRAAMVGAGRESYTTSCSRGISSRGRLHARPVFALKGGQLPAQPVPGEGMWGQGSVEPVKDLCVAATIQG